MQGYELTDCEWRMIEPLLPTSPRGVPRVDDWRVLNGIFWVLRIGMQWRALTNEFWPHTTSYNRFVRWRKAGVWEPVMTAVSQAYDGEADDRQHLGTHPFSMPPTQKSRPDRCMAARGGLTTKMQALTDARGLPVELVLTPPDQAGDCPIAAQLLGHLRQDTIRLADKGLRCRLAPPADRSRRYRTQHSAYDAPPLEAVLQPGALYRARYRIERFFNGMKHFRRRGTRYEKHASNFLAMLKLAAAQLLAAP